MKILALDPASVFGWAISRSIYGHWKFKTMRDESMGMKLIRFKAKLSEVCEKENIKLVVFEIPVSQYKDSIISHSKFVAIIEGYCELNGIDYKGYPPKEIKMFATGKGNSNKEAMVKAAQDKLGYKGNNDNEADALWLLELVKTDLNLL